MLAGPWLPANGALSHGGGGVCVGGEGEGGVDAL